LYEQFDFAPLRHPNAGWREPHLTPINEIVYVRGLMCL
jgi:hypothetical protein